MRLLPALLIVAACSTTQPAAIRPAAVVPQPHAPFHKADILPAEREAAKYIMRPDADPAKIAAIRHKLSGIRTRRDVNSFRKWCIECR